MNDQIMIAEMKILEKKHNDEALNDNAMPTGKWSLGNTTTPQVIGRRGLFAQERIIIFVLQQRMHVGTHVRS